MNPISPKTQHYFFGSPGRLLYGAYHHAVQNRSHHGAILLCYPFGHEYIRSHRTYRQLALKLSNSGFDVLRFDYYGCGDSSGNFEQARLNLWLEDIALALKQLTRRGKPKRLFIGGLRLGGALATITATERNDVDGLILWEPVIDGCNYLDELVREQSRLIRSRQRSFKRLYSNMDVPDEILGFPLASDFKRDISKLDLMAAPPSNTHNILLLSNERKNNFQPYFDKEARGERQATLQVVEEQKLWMESPYKALVPVRSIEFIVSWATSKAES